MQSKRGAPGHRIASLILTASALTCVAIAQTARPATLRHAAAQAAGARALHLCTGYFATDAPRAFTDEIVATNPVSVGPADARTEVDEQAKTVSVHYSDDMVPRIAAARPPIGCTLLPIGASKQLAGTLTQPSAAAPKRDDQPWPMGDKDAIRTLPTGREAAVAQVIEEAFKDAEGIYRGTTWGVVVVKDGKIVAERYQHGFGPHVSARTNSMCKSIGGSLIGVGVRQGLLDMHRRAPLSEWQRAGDPRGDITLNDLMHMASGLYTESAGDRQNDLYYSGATVAEAAALNMVDSKPGVRFVYAGADSLLLVRALRQAIHDDAAFLTFPYRELLWKIGMTRTIMETDWNNDFLTSGQCWSTARDFGRFGLFYLADGVWNGERILPVGWSQYVSTPAPAQPAPGGIGGNARYGAMFWLHGGLEGLPADAYTPFGAGGQYAMIIPSQNLVVVRRGYGGPFNISKFAADVMNALSR
jgi:CubicO group peptidase (beta-lactamase class C family)